MLDATTAERTATVSAATQTYDLVVIGAGVAGLNALYAATEYLPSQAKVLLLDQKDQAGGMWNTAYDYVRLHQPHPMFTVGDMKWDWPKPRDYLAAKSEVQSHLASALTPVAQKVALETGFGQTVAECKEVSVEGGFRAQITFHPNDAPDKTTQILAHRAIHAPGLNYVVPTPLELSSGAVVSAAPANLADTLKDHPGAPVYVVGGGKTAMDTILAVLADDPDREVSLIKGRGTNFLNRTRYIPVGLKRWTSGKLVSRLFHELATYFDGENEEQMIDYFRANHSTDAGAANGVFLFGLQSEEEHSKIQAGLSNSLDGYLKNVADTENGPTLIMRDGTTYPVAKGSIFFNCTGSFFRAPQMGEHLPCLSQHNTVMRVTAREGIHFLTSVAGFFATHLLYRDALRGNGFCTLDHEALFRENRNAWVGAASAQAYMNQTIAVQTLPMMLLDRCGLDLDRWYPLPRRMYGLMQMKSGAAKDIAHCRRVLAKVNERFGPVSKPLD